MPWMTGFTKSFNEGLAGTEEEARKETARLDEMERNIFTALAQSDDPEIASLALSGLLGLASPRKRPTGLRRLIGEMEQSPILGQMRSLLGTPVSRQVTEPGEVRPRAGEAGMPQRPFQGLFGAGALPAQAAVEPGAPLMGMGAQQPRADLTPVEGPPQVRTVTEPRRAFLSPEERAGRTMQAEIGARTGAFTEALRGATTDEERDLILGMAGAPRRQTMLKEGEIVEDPNSSTGYSQILYDQETGATRRIPSGPPRTAGLRKSKVEDPTSKTGWSDVYYMPDGTEAYRVPDVPPSYPPPAYSGVYYTPGPGGSQVPVGITREGGTRELPGAPPRAPDTQQDELAEAARAILRVANTNYRAQVRMNPNLDILTVVGQLAAKDPRFKGMTALQVTQLAERKAAPPPRVPGQAPAEPTGKLDLDVQAVIDRIRANQRRR